MTQTISVTGQEAVKQLNIGAQRVHGEIEHRDQGEAGFTDLPKLVYAVQFSAPLFHEPSITADLKGKAAQDSPQVAVLREKARALVKGDFAAGRRFSTEHANRQTDAFLMKKTIVVWTAVNDLVVHLFQSSVIGLFFKLKKTADTAHGFTLC